MVKIGMALYSVRFEMQKNPISTMKKVGDMGYKALEAANYSFNTNYFLGFDITPDQFKELSKQYGYKLINCHIGRTYMPAAGASNCISKEGPMLLDLEEDDIRRCAEAHLEAGNSCLTIPAVFYPNTVDGVMERMAYLNRMDKVAKESGIRLLYHTHPIEFVYVNNKLIIDYIVENTNLGIELDTYWAMRAGENPIDMIKHLGNRIVFVHQKDFPKNCRQPMNIWHCLGTDMKHGVFPDRHINNREFYSLDNPEPFIEIGLGTMPIQEIIDAVNEYTNAEYIILEQDYSSVDDQLLSAKMSMENFKKYTGILFE